MLMADVLAVFFVVVGLLLAHLGVWLLSRGLWLGHVERAEKQVSERLVLTLLAGIPPTAVAFVVAIVLAKLGGGPGKALAALLGSGFLLFAHAGLSGAILHVGRRLGTSTDTPWRSMFRGGVAVALAYAFPILGWFVLLPASILLGAGASLIAVFRGLLARSPAPQQRTLGVAS
jgi:hypothetical protein